MAVVKNNAEMKRDNMKLEMRKLQKQFGANEVQQQQERNDVKLQMQKLQEQQEQQREDASKLKAEFLELQQTMQVGLKTDVQKLTTDMLGLAENMNDIHDEMDG